MKREHHGAPPTLPPPPLWRLIVAGIAIAGFLYFLYAYQTAVEQRTAPPSSSQSWQTRGDGAPLRLTGLERSDEVASGRKAPVPARLKGQG